MSPLTIWLCVVLFMGIGIAVDTPLIFVEKTIGLLDPARVPLVLTPTDDLVLNFPVAGGHIPGAEVNLTIGDIKKALNARIEPDNPIVREKALLLAGACSGERTIDQICLIYESLKKGDGLIGGWKYVSDPRGIEYFMYPNETLKIGMEKSVLA